MSDDLVVQAFTELAPRYEQTMDRELRQLWGLRYEQLVGQLVDLASRSGARVVLDVATGTAQIPMTMAGQARAKTMTIGLDITPAMLNQGLAHIQARQLNSRIRLVCASAMDMPFGESRFDTVICAFAMHHMDVAKVLPEIGRVLQDRGQLLLACVIAPRSWRSRYAMALLRAIGWAYVATHRGARPRAEVDAIPNIRTVAEWKSLLLAAGFDAIEIVARFSGRRLWYPGAFALRATKRRL